MITAVRVMVKEKKKTKQKKIPFLRIIFYGLLGGAIAFFILLISGILYFENTYRQKVYPGIKIDGVSFGGKAQKEVEDYFLQKSKPFSDIKFILTGEDKATTLSGEMLGISFDSKLSAQQAYSVGRSKHFLSNFYQKWKAAKTGINLPSALKFNTDFLEETLDNLAAGIDIVPEDALFQFENGKVSIFRLSKAGRSLDKKQTKELIYSYINAFRREEEVNPQEIVINLPIQEVFPKITTENSNNFGIKELLGRGNSKFLGSITNRVHNIDLASSKLNGHLVPPGSTFSFNETLGDVSVSTGFQPAYIIKEGRTVLGDGGGVCQVSTTLFRAALNSGLPIIERTAHAYRVSYYEQDSSPGIDATVFDPTHDLKFKNDTQNYLLIQARTDRTNYTLTFEIYGTTDGRQIEITKPVIWSQTPPPPDLYQDDPTLPKGVVKQVDWRAWGAKVSFDYKVTKNTEVVLQKTFTSNYKPWQAVFLRGTRE